MMSFEEILERFVTAVGAADTHGLAALFTPDGVYDDYFFGPHQGRDAIAHMLERFYVGGEAFVWEFTEPACSGDTAYARYCFSYRSREPDSTGELIVFEGISRFRLEDGLIAHYTEVFDRGVAFTQLGYAPGRITRLLERYAKGFRQSEPVAGHTTYRDRILKARS
jgi:ketosteroid isomerase-like protein